MSTIIKMKLYSLLIFGLITCVQAIGGTTQCNKEVGSRVANILVDWCLNVSPATRPPCNKLNSCDLIANEVGRGCSFLSEDTSPYYCAGDKMSSEIIIERAIKAEKFKSK